MQTLFKKIYRLPAIFYGLLAVYLLAQFGRGTSSTLEVTDHLDIITPILSTITPAQLFGPGDAIVPNVMGGLPRWALLGAGPFNLVSVANVFLGGFFSIVVIESLIRFLALWALPKLLLRHTGVKDPLIAWGVGLCFAILPINYSVLGVILLAPLIALSFLELLSGRSRWWAAGLIIYPLLAPLPLGFPAFFLLGGLALYKCLNDRTLIYRCVFILGLFTVLYAALEYRILLQVFFHQGFISQRTERIWPHADFNGALSLFTHFLLTANGEYHTSSHFFPVILLNLLLVVYMPKRLRGTLPQAFWPLIGLHVLLAAIYSFWFTPPVLAIQNWLGITTLYLARAVYLWPPLLYSCWALALSALPQKKPYRLLIIAVQFIYLCSLSQAAYIFFDRHTMSYDQYFSPRLFSQIKDKIGEPQSSYRVVSLGLPANVPLYSGFYTLDGYINNYPVEYKHRFRSVMAPELDKDEPAAAYLRQEFDNTGNFLNLYAVDIAWYWLGDVIPRGQSQYMMRNYPPVHLAYDVSGFYPFGARYLLSGVEVADAWKNGLTLVDAFSDDDSPYLIRLYRIHKPVEQHNP